LDFFLEPGTKSLSNQLNNILIEERFGILRVPSGLEAISLALVGAEHSDGQVYFVENSGFLPEVRKAGAHAIICSPDLEEEVRDMGALPLLSERPKETFYLLYNHIAKMRLSGLAPTVVHPSARIDPSARVALRGVIIGEQVEILAGTQILERVRLDRDSIIGPGAIVGSIGFEFKKKPTEGYLSVIHDGYVKVGAECHIGPGSVIAQGFWDRPTLIGNQTKLDHMVGISHGVQLGSSNLVAAGAILAGSVESGDGVWIGPGAIVSNGVKLGSFSRVEIGSVVLRDLTVNSRVFGNPAREMPK
jgi:UDP-3-O-[3-hydroxymyristoyl] glucosamine N-acyltransferase